MVDLTKQEQQMFDGEMDEAAQQSMEILVALARIYKAKRMIPVKSAQISGVSYKTIGDAGLEYLQDLVSKGAKVGIPSFLNPAGMDISQWRDMNVPPDFARKQIEVLDAYSSMGIMKSCTCTPYLIGIIPGLGEHVAWAESSAVSYANSILGARTNREGGPSALASAICGVTPYYGLHKEENRKAKLQVNVVCSLDSLSDFAALGYAVGKLSNRKYPAFKGISRASKEQLKVLGASMAASGSVPLFFIEGITPELNISDDPEIREIGRSGIEDAISELDSGEKPDLVTLGCPHASIDEIKEISELVMDKTPTVKFWICTAKKTKEEADRLGLSSVIEKAGGRIVSDTCMVVSPLERMGYSVTGTNSAKAAKYLPSMCGQRTVFGNIRDILYR